MRSLSLVSDAHVPCGVEHFARTLASRLADRAPGDHDTMALTGQPGETAVLRRGLTNRDTLIVNFPVVAWKRQLVSPLRAMATARRSGVRVLLVLHEWADLDWKRRLALLPALRLADRVLVSSPLVRDGLSSDRASRLMRNTAGLVPIPPNLRAPAALPATPLSQQLEQLKVSGALLVGTFGAIYPKKQPTAVLDIVAALRAQGRDAHAVFVGDFVRGGSIDPEAGLAAAAAERGLTGKTSVTGFIGPADELFAALSRLDVLVYDFAEGLTSRRGSVLAAMQSGRPVLVNGSRRADEFDHHPTYRRAIASGALTLLPPAAPATAFADAIVTAVARSASAGPSIDFDAAWSDAVDAVSGSLRLDTGPSSSTA
ncbi:MAG: glycosyltransferase [Hyphomicrobiales bacterium]|nr:glycosyltransferase [Hyphomicrobiales bacterium]